MLIINRLIYRASHNADDWNQKLSQAFEYVTADDFSYSIAAFGFGSFKEMKKKLASYDNASVRKYFYSRNTFEADVRKRQKLEERISIQNDQLEEDIKDLWPKYKETYLKYMNKHEER